MLSLSHAGFCSAAQVHALAALLKCTTFFDTFASSQCKFDQICVDRWSMHRVIIIIIIITNSWFRVCRAVTEGQAFPLQDIAARFEDNTIAFLKLLSELYLQSRYIWGARISDLLLHLDFLGQRDVDVPLT
jgi:hypothetical protein